MHSFPNNKLNQARPRAGLGTTQDLSQEPHGQAGPCPGQETQVQPQVPPVNHTSPHSHTPTCQALCARRTPKPPRLVQAIPGAQLQDVGMMDVTIAGPIPSRRGMFLETSLHLLRAPCLVKRRTWNTGVPPLSGVVFVMS